MKTHAQLIELLRHAWENLDIESVVPYLSDDLHYSSWWVMEELHSKEEYLNYIRSKFLTFKEVSVKPLVKLAVNQTTGEHAVAIRQGEASPVLIRIKVDNGMSIEMWMQPG